MHVGESNDLPQVLLVNFTEHIQHGDRLIREPDVVNDALKAWRVVGERQLAYSRIRAAQPEVMRDASLRKLAIVLPDEIGMIAAHGPARQQLVNTGFRNGLEVTTDDHRHL